MSLDPEPDRLPGHAEDPDHFDLRASGQHRFDRPNAKAFLGRRIVVMQ